MIHGIIDIGSNTVRMAVYKVEGHKLELLIKKKHMVGLAAYIEENCMQRQGIDKACEILQEFKLFLETFQITDITAFTTAALRNVDNSDAAVKEISERTGIEVRVMSGEEEANYDFIGAVHSQDIKDGLLIDIGGASTELVLYQSGKILQMASLPLGSLAVYKKYVTELLPSAAEADKIRRAVITEMENLAADFPRNGGQEICGIGGSFKGIWQLYADLYSADKACRQMESEKIDAMVDKFIDGSRVSDKEILELLIQNVPERVKTVIPGMIIADTFIKYFSSAKIVYSDSGVREGFLYNKIIAR